MKYVKGKIYAISALLVLLLITSIIVFYLYYLSEKAFRYKILYYHLSKKDFSLITDTLNEWGYDYKINDTDILVNKDKISEIRMKLAKKNIIKSKGIKTKRYTPSNNKKSLTYVIYYSIFFGFGMIFLLMILVFLIIITILIKVHYGNKRTQLFLELAMKKIDTITKSLLNKKDN